MTTNDDLSKKQCIPCRGGTPPMSDAEIRALLPKLHADWKVQDAQKLMRTWRFPDFKQALDFTVKVGDIAERENHHPDIALSWGKVSITLWTHKINGLTESDFILAAKIDTIS